MVSRGKYANAITLLEDPVPFQRAALEGKLTFGGETDGMSVWDFMEPLGVKAGIDLGASPASATFAWLIVVVNSLPSPLVLEKIHLTAGEQVGFAAVTDLKKYLPGSEDQIPGLTDHPLHPGVQLTGVGAWTFHSASNDSFEMSMRFSHATASGDAGNAVAIAAKDEALWKTAVTAQTTDLDQFKTPATDTPEKILQAFFDKRTGDQGDYDAVGTETRVFVRLVNSPGPKERNPSRCVVAWIRPIVSTDPASDSSKS